MLTKIIFTFTKRIVLAVHSCYDTREKAVLNGLFKHFELRNGTLRYENVFKTGRRRLPDETAA